MYKRQPLAPAVDRLVAGIERRSAHVYAQGWLRAMQPLRAALPALVALGGPREMRRVQSRLGGVRPGLVGAGGAADTAASTQGLSTKGLSTERY